MFDPSGVEDHYRTLFNYKYVTPLGSWDCLFILGLQTFDRAGVLGFNAYFCSSAGI